MNDKFNQAIQLIVENANDLWEAYKETDNVSYSDVVGVLDEALELLRKARRLSGNLE